MEVVKNLGGGVVLGFSAKKMCLGRDAQAQGIVIFTKWGPVWAPFGNTSIPLSLGIGGRTFRPRDG